MSTITTATNFIEKAKGVHGNLYDYSKTVYLNAKTNMVITCNIHGDFLQKSNNHLRGQGCPKCGIKKCAKNISVPFEEFIKRANQKHCNKFQYVKDSYINMTSNMIIICPSHGNIQMTPISHCKSLHGCSKCGDISAGNKKLIPKEVFLEKCKQLHNNRYSYEYVKFNTTLDKIEIVCRKHGLFTQEANKHYHGAGCRKCADDKIGVRNRKTTEQYIADARRIWGDRYDYSLVKYTNGKDVINIICRVHGVFEKIAREHLYQQGCQLCISKRFSTLGISWLNYMKVSHNANIQHNGNPENDGEHRIKNSLYHADGYCQETNTIFEFHGSYWHGDPSVYSFDKVNAHNGKTFGELYQNTRKKLEHCKENGYTYIECWESAWLKGIKALKKIQRAFRNKNI